MTTPYALPPPIVTIVHGFTPEQMQQAFKDGAASRDGEVEALRIRLIENNKRRKATVIKNIELTNEVEALRAVIKRVQHIALIDPPHTGQMMEIAAAIAAEATK